MSKYNLELQDTELDEITLNKHGDSILVSGEDAGLFKKFTGGYKKFLDLAEEYSKKTGEFNDAEDGDFLKSLESLDSATGALCEFCQKSVEIADEIFGEGIMKKSFRDDYERTPDFIPGPKKIAAFFKTMAPIMEDIFEKSMDLQEESSKQRMEKYVPQDHKKPGGR